MKYIDPGHPKVGYVCLLGVALAVGIIAYYRALALGPVSVVVPVFGLFLVTSSVVGIAALDEALTVRKAAELLLETHNIRDTAAMLTRVGVE